MAANITTEFAFIVTAAKAAVESLNLKGSRSTAAIAFIEADDDFTREAVVESYGAGKVRRGLRQLARAQKDADVAGTFYAMRDLIDTDGTVYTEEDLQGTDAVEAAA